MAFGAVRGTLTGGANSITNPQTATGSVSVSVGDLVVAVIAQQTSLTVTACGDNLHGGSTYTAQNAGTDAGNITGRMFYIRVTAPGTLSTVSFVTTSSANDVSCCAVAYEGPFTAPPIDTNVANISNDITTPYAGTATGTLAQTRELVVGWIARDGNNAFTGSAITKDAEQLQSANASSSIGSVVTSATTSVTPAWTGTAPTTDVIGSCSFKQDPVTVKSITVRSLGQTQSVRRDTGHRVPVAQAQNISGTAFADILHAEVIGLGLWQVVSGAAQAIILQAATTGSGLAQVLTVARNFVAGGGGVTQKALNFLTGQNVFGTANATIAVAATTATGQAQLLGVTPTKVTGGGAVTQWALNFFQAQNVSGAANATISAGVTTGSGLRQIISLTAIKPVMRTINVAGIAQNVYGAANLAATLAATTGSGLAQLINVTRNFVSGGGGVTQKAINIAQAMTHRLHVEVGLIRSGLSAIVIGQNVSGVANLAATLTATTGAGLAQIINITRNFVAGGGGVTQKAITLTQALYHRLHAEVNLIRFMAGVTSGLHNTVSLLKAKVGPTKILNVVQSINASGRAAANILAGGLSGSPLAQIITVTRNFVAGGGATTQKVINIVQAQSVRLQRALRKIITISTGEVITFSRIVTQAGAKVIFVMQAQAIRLQTAIGHRILLTMSQAVTVLRGMNKRIIVRGLSQVVSVLRSLGKGKLITLTQAQLVTLRRSFGEFILILQSQAVSMRKAVGKIIVVLIAQTISITRANLHKIIVAPISQLVTVSAPLFATIFKTISVTTGQSVRLFWSTFIKPIRRITTRRGGDGDISDGERRSNYDGERRIPNNWQ